MRAAAVVVLAVLAGCGRLGFDALERSGTDGAVAGDTAAPPDGAKATCASFGDWGPPALVAGLSTGSSTDWGPSLSRDELEIVFASDRSGAFLIYHATRATRLGDWSAPVALTEIPAPAQDPSLSSDRLELYWGATGQVGHATRASLTAPFANQELILPPTADYSGSSGPDISRDGLSLVFNGTAMADGLWHEYVTTRAQRTDAFPDGALLPGAFRADGDAFGSLRGDGLELAYSNEPAGAASDIFSATRTTPTGTFGAAAAVTVVNSTANDGDVDLSDDGLTMTFESDRAGTPDIYQSTRRCN